MERPVIIKLTLSGIVAFRSEGKKGEHSIKTQPKWKVTRAKMLHAAVTLFLEKGYQNTTTSEISEKAGYSPAMIFSSFPDKESILYALIGYMFEDQFAATASLLGPGCEPLFFYCVETALQLHITELSEPLRDLYVTAYTLQSTSEFIYQSMAKKLPGIFQGQLPGYTQEDFYELEIASGSVMRGYMAKECTAGFPIEKKTARFLEASLSIYQVPRAVIGELIKRILSMDLKALAGEIIKKTVEKAEQGFDPEPR